MLFRVELPRTGVSPEIAIPFVTCFFCSNQTVAMAALWENTVASLRRKERYSQGAKAEAFSPLIQITFDLKI